MSKVIEHKKFVCAEVDENHNKVWLYKLFDNGDLYVAWGRVGKTLQEKMHAGGSHKLSGLLSNKRGKGYKEVAVIETVAQGTSKPVQSHDLAKVATEQISHSSPEVAKLITWLASVNRHAILSTTNLTFNETTGLFSTPLGIVTPGSISQARNLLVTMGDFVAKREFDNRGYIESLQDYLVLIPQDVGMKRGWHFTFLPDVRAVQKQNDILDSLEASYRAATTSKRKSTAKDEPAEKVFDVQLDVLDMNDAIARRLVDLHYKTRSSQHSCYHLKPKKVYKLEIAEMHEAFENHGRSMGNVMELFHGTSAANLLSILKSGLHVTPPSSAAITGKMFGPGTYFANCSTKSLNYSYGYWGGSGSFSRYFLFVANVAMGKYFVPSGQTSSRPPHGYDSYFAKARQSGVMNDELVTFKDHQADLRFLMEFE